MGYLTATILESELDAFSQGFTVFQLLFLLGVIMERLVIAATGMKAAHLEPG